MPQADGHTLVIPKADAQDMFDVEPDMAAALMKTTQKVAKAVKKAMAAKGIMLAQLNGSAAGQSVFHVHFHIIPRHQGIDLRMHAGAAADPESLKKIAEKIAAAID